MNKILDKFKGCLIGGAVGDALGYPIEFIKLNKNEKITRYNNKGIISDDTQMTLFTANGLLWGETRYKLRGISPKVSDCIYLAYKDWYKTQSKYPNEINISWIAFLPELNVQRAPGNTCLHSLGGSTKGTIDNPINNSKGCGSVMRVAPIGLFFQYNKEKTHEIGMYGAETGAITHGHPLAIIPCYVLSIIINILTYTNKTIEEATTEALEVLNNNKDTFDKESINYFIKLIEKAVKLTHNKLISDRKAIEELGEGWVAEEALAIALYSAIKYSNDFEKAIVCSVNHNGDSDSTGAITGNIIGTYLGYDKIPSYYIDDLELKDIIIEIAEDLYYKFPEKKNEYWLSKYLYIKRDISKK